MIGWAAVSACTATVHNYTGLIICRFFLGFIEAPVSILTVTVLRNALNGVSFILGHSICSPSSIPEKRSRLVYLFYIQGRLLVLLALD